MMPAAVMKSNADRPDQIGYAAPLAAVEIDPAIHRAV
jgi:hypothetical protein